MNGQQETADAVRFPMGAPGGDHAARVAPETVAAAVAALSDVMGEDSDLTAVLQAVTDVGRELAGARYGAFFHRVPAGADSDDDVVPLVTSGEIDPTPLPAPVWTTSGPVTIRRGDLGGEGPVRSYLALPVETRGGRLMGALVYGHDAPGVFDRYGERTIRILSSLAAVAVENARLFAAEQVARKQAEHAAAQLRLLQALTTQLASALTTAEAVRAVSDTLADALDVARMGLYLRSGGGFRAVAGLRRDSGLGASGSGGQTGPSGPHLRELPAELPNPVAVATGGGRPVVVRDAEHCAELFPQIAALGLADLGSSVTVPLMMGGTAIGALALAWDGTREFAASELDLLQVAAGHLASTVERARLFEAERLTRDQSDPGAIARGEPDPVAPGTAAVSVAQRHRPADADPADTGRWADVVTTGHRVNLVVGDVQNDGLGVDAVTTRLRVGLHAYLAEGHPPHEAIARANRLLRGIDPRLLATCCVVTLDPVRGTAHVVRAGHVPPLRQHPDGSVEEIDATGSVPLGVFDDWTWPVSDYPLERGERIVLHTDDGRGALRSTLARTRGVDVEIAADALVTRDDPLRAAMEHLVVLVCDYAGHEASSSASLALRAEPRMAGRARAFVRDYLQEWELAELVDDAELLVSEMVTNVLLHTDGDASVELQRVGGSVTIRVADASGSRSPHVNRAPSTDALGGRGMTLVSTLAASWGVEADGAGKVVWAVLDA